MGGALRCDLARLGATDLHGPLERVETQILAFANLHRFLVVGASNDWILVQSYFVNLLKAVSEAVLKPRGIRCDVRVDAGELQSERCELLGLVIAELVTNAAKHAFSWHMNRLVRIELIRNANVWFCTVIDNGGGLTATPPGVGSSIIRQLVGRLGGHVATKSGKGGTSVVVTCPDCGADRDER